jgi:hypothetical protein
MEIQFRNVVTILNIGVLIAGSGIAIVYDTSIKPVDAETKTISPDGTIEITYNKRIPLGENQIFNI